MSEAKTLSHETDGNVISVEFKRAGRKCPIKKSEDLRKDLPSQLQLDLQAFEARLKDNVIIRRNLDGSYQAQLKDTSLVAMPRLSSRSIRNFGLKKTVFKIFALKASAESPEKAVCLLMNKVGQSVFEFFTGGQKTEIFWSRDGRAYENLFAMCHAMYHPRHFFFGPLKGRAFC